MLHITRTLVASTQKSPKAWMATSLRTYLGYFSLFLQHQSVVRLRGSSHTRHT